MCDTYMLINVYAIRSSNGSSPGVKLEINGLGLCYFSIVSLIAEIYYTTFPNEGSMNRYRFVFPTRIE